MDIVERLRNYDHDFDGKLPVLSEAADEIERLREALKFYADEKRWRQEWDNQFHRMVCDAHSDGGAIALAALKGGE